MECEEHRDLLRSMLMTASDVSAITKPWEVQKRVRRSRVCISRVIGQSL